MIVEGEPGEGKTRLIEEVVANARLDEASDPASADYPYGGPGVQQRGRKIEGGR